MRNSDPLTVCGSDVVGFLCAGKGGENETERDASTSYLAHECEKTDTLTLFKAKNAFVVLGLFGQEGLVCVLHADRRSRTARTARWSSPPASSSISPSTSTFLFRL